MNRKAIFAAGAVGVLVLAAVTAAILIRSPDGPTVRDVEVATSRSEDYQQLLSLLEAEGVDTLTDTDGDGLPDALENYLYGSDPHAFSTTGSGVPDGWLARHGFDPTRLGVERTPAATPPADQLPEVYDGRWPDRYPWTLADAYAHGMPDGHEGSWDSGIDPHEWSATPKGVPYAWLHHQGLPGNDPELFERRLGADTLTVRQNYQHDTDPQLADTDDDGLSDADELQRYGTDPRNNSTSGSGAPDGWLVHHSLDPTDRTIGSRDPNGKGMTVAEVWHYNEDRFGRDEALAGAGLDPTSMSHRGDGIPDGWLVANDLDPLDPDIASQVASCAKDYAGVRNLTQAPPGREPIPDLCLTVGGAYSHGRPTGWDESLHGPWPGGLDPSASDQDGDGLPDVVEIRGWYAQRTTGLGPDAEPEWFRTASSPLRSDTDGDGLTDHEEYHGEAVRDGATYSFPPSDPANPDTAFSGMTDAEKVFGTFAGTSYDLHEETGGSLEPMLDPTRRDTAGDYLTDGDAMAYWATTAQNVLNASKPYNGEGAFPRSNHGRYLDWINLLPWVREAGLTFDLAGAAALLAPDGDADGDGVPNVVDPFASNDGIRNGWKVHPATLRFSDFRQGPTRLPMDPANPDTAGDGLPDAWKLQHGMPQATGWDLEPAAYDSDLDGISDWDENLDGDVVLWPSLDGTVSLFPWAYTNEFEFKRGTDPHAKDPSGNFVTDGWRYFWGTVYYEEIKDAKGDLETGTLVPTPGPEMDALRARLAPSPDETPVGKRSKDTFEYVRIIEAPSSGDLDDLLDPGREESFRMQPTMVSVLRPEGAVDLRLAVITGTATHTFRIDAARNLNPYLLDTDGDGMSDAWEIHYSHCGLDPLAPDSGLDADRDGLTNFAEQGAGDQDGTDPCLSDTDMDGLDDGEENALMMDPNDPRDAGQLQGDEDGDGISNVDEGIGGTDLNRVDTDIDGLLDGYNLPTSAALPLTSGRIEELKGLGIAHRTAANPNPPCYTNQAATELCFYGEGPLGEAPIEAANSTQFDSLVKGVPDGWSVYNNQKSRVTAQSMVAAIAAKYQCGQPGWWEEEKLGVWWWGLQRIGDNRALPGTDSCPHDLDLDMDGLHDRNGEDPVPAASQSNDAAGVDLESLNKTLSGVDLVRAAQAWGECAGNPEPCFVSWAASKAGIANLRAAVDVTAQTDLEAFDAQSNDAQSKDLPKNTPFSVTGSVVTCAEAGCATGVPNRTVVVRLVDASANALDYDFTDAASRILGVGFTKTDGSFSVMACLCAADGAVGVPDGVVALGRRGGQAVWPSSAADVPVGASLRMVVHVYATNLTTDPTHPQYVQALAAEGYNATERAWKQVNPVKVTSATQLSLSAPAKVAWEETRTLTVRATLLDLSGEPASGQNLLFRLRDIDGAPIVSATVLSDGAGIATFEYDLADDLAGMVTVNATYAGNDLLSASAAESTTILQTPVTLEADAPAVGRLGEDVTVTVRALSLGTPVQNLTVRAELASSAIAGITGADGRVTLALRPSGQPRSATLDITSGETDHHLAANANRTVSLVSGSILTLHDPGDADRGANIAVAGRLTLMDGTPISAATIWVSLAGNETEAITGADGTFSDAVAVPVDLPLGSILLRSEYLGQPNRIDEASAEKTLRVVVGTRIDIDAMHAGRSDAVTLRGALALLGGAPVLGEDVTIDLPWGDNVTVRTGLGGAYSANVVIPADHALGTFHINASYAGSSNATFGASDAWASINISAPTTLEAEPIGTVFRGAGTVVGQLLDAETGAPLAAAKIHATMPFGPPQVGTTDKDGRVEFPMEIPLDVPSGPLNATLSYAGGDGYAPANASTVGMLRVPSRLVLSAPVEFGRGTTHPIEVVLLDDRDEPVRNRNVALRVLGQELHAIGGSDGVANFTVEVPKDAPLGTTSVQASWVGDAAHEPYQTQRQATIKDGVRIRIDGVPDQVQAGQVVQVRIHVEDMAGKPVQTRLFLQVHGVPGTILVETDEAGDASASFTVHEAQALALTVRFPGQEHLAARSETVSSPIQLASLAIPASNGNVTPVIVAAGLGVLVLAAVPVVLRVRRARHLPTQVLEETRARIGTGDRWADAILDAYARLSAYLREHGILEAESQTSRSFAQSLVDAGVMDERAAVALVTLFERARYAQADLNPGDAERARRVLDQAIHSTDRLAARTRPGGVGS